MGRLLEDPLGVSDRIDQFLGPNTYTWEEFQTILGTLFTTEERQMIRQAGMRMWERNNQSGPLGEVKWPSQNLHWDQQVEAGRQNMRDLRNMIVQGIREAVPRGQIINRLFSEHQGKDESLTEWLERLRRNLQLYSGTDPNTPIGEVLLKTQFVAQSWGDIRRKLEKIEDWQDRGLQELLREAQKAYITQDEEKQKAKAKIFVAAWIEGFSEKAKFLYGKLAEDRIKWTRDDEEKFERLKEALINAPVLSLPDLKCPFQLYINASQHTAYRILTQDGAGQRKPIGYYSKILDPVSRGWPTCLQTLVAAALLMEEARKVTFGSSITIYTPHDLRAILAQQAEKWLTDSQMLKYEAILVEAPGLELRVTSAQNPSQFLYGEPTELLYHDCIKAIGIQTKIRPDLEEIELEEGEKLFVDGSSRVLEGNRWSGYAIVNGKEMRTRESGPLSKAWSAQACELYALYRALELLKGKKRTIYTDSEYAYGVVHTFGKIWEERDLIGTQGKGLVHQELITMGQVAINATFGKDIYLPEDAEFYFVYSGSVQRHIMFAKQISDNALQSVVPEQRHSTLDVLKKFKTPPTFFSAARLSTMLNRSDKVYANCMVIDQVGDLKTNYIHGDSVSSEACLNPTNSTPMAKSSSSPSLEEKDQSIYDPNEGSQISVKNGDNVGVRHRADSYLPVKTHGFIKERGQLHADVKIRSSSLDDLEVDSGTESVSDRSLVHYLPLSSSEAMPSNRDGIVSPETSTGFNINQAESLSLSTSLQPKETVLKTATSRLVVVAQIHYCVFMNSGQSLLQALSLSKSVSLLHPCKKLYSLPKQSLEKRIQEEEWDKYMAPSKTESEKCKVSRTFSFLMNRMSSTRNKCKTKSKDAKEEKLNRHNFINGTFSGVMPCTACKKAILGKESLQCSYCNVIVHKNCKECAPVCTKKLQERCHNKNKPQAGLTNSSLGDIPQPVFSLVHPSSSLPIGLSAARREASQQSHSLSKSIPSASFERRSMPFPEQDSEMSTWRFKSRSEEMLQALGTFSSTDSFMMEDDVDSSQWTDISTEAQEFEAVSWSLVVDPGFCSKQEKDVIKRQDVILELMQTEAHHSHTLFIMSEIFRKGMKEELQLDHSTVDKIFPCLDELLEIHRQFFCRMKERRQESCEEGSECNFVISRIGDILVQQFSEENVSKMKKIYGEFCNHQKEAVNLFKELQQNKKFQNFIKVSFHGRTMSFMTSLLSLSYFFNCVLFGFIFIFATEGTEEHKVRLIKDMIAAVDLKVNEYEKRQKFLEILSRTENKTYTKLKNGHVFRKQNLMRKERILLHEDLVYWKTATGHFKDILALLLTDVLLFLQEKDQKYVFAAVDQKPSVISLQKLIVREVANEERGMFLISASSAGPEMYEVHTSSKEEHNSWMRHIQDAVESCPEEEEGGKMSESDEDQCIAEAKASRIQKCQESLSNQDQQICSYLEDKLHIYAELGGMSEFEDVHVEPRETPQAASLLAAALREVESLQDAIILSSVSETRSSEESTEELILEHRLSANEILETFSDGAEMKGDEELSEVCLSASPVENEMMVASLEYKGGSMSFPGSTGTEVVQAIQNLTHLLYGIQAVLTIQDSHRELHKLLLQENEKTSWGHSSRVNLLQEQEKYWNMEKRREELANIHKLKQQFQQEKQCWSWECEQRQQEQEARESWLGQRERECGCQEELLERSREGLELQLQEYQQSLERLQEGQQMVEKERNSVKMQQKLLWCWKQSQSSLFSSSGNHEIMERNSSDSLHGENSFYLNEAVVHMSLSSLNRSNSSLVYEDGMYELNISNSDTARTSENQVHLKMDTSCQPTLTNELWKSSGPYQQVSFSCKSNKDAFNNGN
ncbi:LOW QUALITY PROTEIN: rho guanine nucleotide exchange factor 28-like [Eudromia elegans]